MDKRTTPVTVIKAEPSFNSSHWYPISYHFFAKVKRVTLFSEGRSHDPPTETSNMKTNQQTNPYTFATTQIQNLHNDNFIETIYCSKLYQIFNTLFVSVYVHAPWSTAGEKVKIILLPILYQSIFSIAQSVKPLSITYFVILYQINSDNFEFVFSIH